MSSNNVRRLITRAITTLQDFATLHHTSPNYTYSHLHFTTLSLGLTHSHFLPLYFTSHH